MQCVICDGPVRNYGWDDVRVCRNCELERHTTVVDGQYRDPADGELHRLTPELFIEMSFWRFARTMPTVPHEYTVRDLRNPNAHQSTCLSHDTFEWFVRLIREKGEPRKWKDGRTWIYYWVNGQKYWTGHAPTEITTVVNRELALPT